jgi:hypothetical protein
MSTFEKLSTGRSEDSRTRHWRLVVDGMDVSGLGGRHLQEYLPHPHAKKNDALQDPVGLLLTTCFLLLGYAGKLKQACRCVRGVCELNCSRFERLIR